MKAIDFSCKHNVLIRRKDGRLVPMDEPCYETKKIAPGTWQIMSSGDYHYLLEGDEEAVSIDTGYGAGNLREYLESLCGKPVRCCINTHHHFDHSANNCYFDVVYMAEESVEQAAVPYPSFDGIEFPRDYEVEIVKDGYIIPLKGRELEIFKIGDHTAGGIAILDRKERLMFTGDEIMPGGKMISGTVEKFERDMGKLTMHRDEFDYCCGGPEILPGEMAVTFHEAAQKILAGETCEVPDEPPRHRPNFDSVDGPVIYDCQHPHPEDVPGGAKRGGGGPRVMPAEMGVFIHNGQRFMYNKNKLHD